MKQLVTNDTLKKRMNIANIANERIDNAIQESQYLDIVPVITEKVYDYIIANPTATAVTLLMKGGEYTGLDTCKKYFAGLELAICYYAYARLLATGATNLTPYGVVVKTTDVSQPASNALVTNAINQTKAVANAYLSAALQYIAVTDVFEYTTYGSVPVKTIRKFKVIGE